MAVGALGHDSVELQNFFFYLFTRDLGVRMCNLNFNNLQNKKHPNIQVYVG